MNDFFPNTLSYIIGNGAANPYSEYGSRVIFYMQYFGYFQADIGMIGDYSKYGIFFVLTGLFLIFRIITMRMPAEISFVKYMFAGTLLMSFTGSGFFSEP
ncbi:MAG: hypothetical protein HC905_11580, partial [Bacteroidales bacterium]|nr:hypothetical protein [Bacteroidales bacterium]